MLLARDGDDGDDDGDDDDEAITCEVFTDQELLIGMHGGWQLDKDCAIEQLEADFPNQVAMFVIYLTIQPPLTIRVCHDRQRYSVTPWRIFCEVMHDRKKLLSKNRSEPPAWSQTKIHLL